ncbi:hypothetical protein CL176_00765 [Suicoccus acidiformans]|uniref:DUF924 domain-containing protein n=1 Tax=Suicoccus acidiformans TaxID=2036206 RepID=A0A347WHW8_9LACT|nr:DUF924 family protein [Suicoccus acidiformans]AXY24675.1 hypothetical protein CL176_00765 [Suicoccus acidiformans]
MKTAQDVLDFWFAPEHADKLFDKDPTFDQKIRDAFFETWEAACEGLCYTWRDTTKGRIAEIIVLDQFSRNLMRQDPRSYSQDTMALVLSQEVIEQPDFADLPENYKHFAIMPFMHSESQGIHELAVPLFEKHASGALDYEIQHKEIIDQFGYYPHRKKELGEELTAEEEAFLQNDGTSF